MTVKNNKSIFEDLWDRKVPQYLGSYLAIGFGLLQFLAFITQRYALSEFLVDKYLLIWLLLIPAITTLIYFGGKLTPISNARQLKWPKYLVIGNCIVALFLGGFLFNGGTTKASEIIELTDEEGKQVMAVVPSLTKVKSIASFQFENLTGDEKQDWLGIAFSHLLQLDLDQRSEFYTISAYGLNSLYNSFGLPSFSIPNVAIQRKIAQKARNDYFTRISYDTENGQYVFKGKLHSSRDGKEIIDLYAINEDFYLAIDELKNKLPLIFQMLWKR